MENYFLTNYSLSVSEILQSLFISEYGLRHLAHSKTETQYKWGHTFIAIVELCPLIGLIATVIERIVAKYWLIQDNLWLFSGSQNDCNGSVFVEKVQSRLERINKDCPPGILFNVKKINPSITGGTCTAMSLKFLKAYFKAKMKSNHRPEVLQEELVKSKGKFAKSSEKMRIRQAAYNTIEVKLENSFRKIDYSKNKVQALANDRSLKIDASSAEIDMKKSFNESGFASEVEKLPTGAFLVRILKPANNEKLEEHGHSLVYVKEKELSLFYDPNCGVRVLSPYKHAIVLFDLFKVYYESFEVSKARFYRLEPDVLRTKLRVATVND